MPAGKAHEALERTTDDSEVGGWHIPVGPRQETTRAAKMGRREAWARFLAYDVSTPLHASANHILKPALTFGHPSASQGSCKSMQ